MVTVATNRYYTSHVDKPWWLESDYKNVEYQNSPFNDAMTVRYWKKIGYNQSNFTGDMYGMPNDTPEWIEKFKEIFDWKHFSWQLYKMQPGRTLPAHCDTYAKFKELHGITDSSNIWRAIIFLEPWQSGHYFEIDTTNLGYWKKGDYVVWQNQARHIAANVGETDRYTLQITGVE